MKATVEAMGWLLRIDSDMLRELRAVVGNMTANEWEGFGGTMAGMDEIYAALDRAARDISSPHRAH